MGSVDSQNQIPIINLSKISFHSDRGTQEWNHFCEKVREACENFGCFEVIYDKMSTQLRNDTFSMTKEVFDLPLETKMKNTNPKPMHGYGGQLAFVPLYESLGIEDAANYDSITSFAGLLWPHGHPQFCQIMGSMMKPLSELQQTIEMMILDSLGLGEKFGSTMKYKTLLKMNKYRAPPPGECMVGLMTHTDKPYFTLLFDDQVSGLQVETKDGKCIELRPSPSSLVFIIGDTLKALSNGRIHAPLHTVMMKGEKDRYSMAAFAFPVDDIMIEPLKELVDENHPQLFKKFDYNNFLNFISTEEGRAIKHDKQLYAYAGIQ